MNETQLAEKIDQFDRDGLVVLRDLFSEQQIDTHQRLIRDVRGWINESKDANGFGDRIGQIHQKEPDLMALAANPTLLKFLGRILCDEPLLFGSLNFEKGTEQAIHVDAIFFWPEPWYSMAGAWIALEDTDANNGPLMYVPGSHKWDLIRGEDLVADRPDLFQARESARAGSLSAQEKGDLVAALGNVWTEKYRAQMDRQGATSPASVSVKKGDVVIWHSLLGHGGGRINDRARSRNSVVYHFLGAQTKLFSFEKFILLNRDEFHADEAEQASIRKYGNLRYMHFPYYVSYMNGQQQLHHL